MPPSRSHSPLPRLTPSHYETLVAFRQALRRFLHFSQRAAKAEGLPPQQHQALLAIKGGGDRSYPSIRELAAQLELRHHSVVGLVDRLAARGLVRRGVSAADRRQVELRLTPRGERLIQRLSAAHWRELRELRPGLRRLLERVERG